jgi:hypothetical protein
MTHKAAKHASASSESGSRLLGETADILREDMQLVDMEEFWFEGPSVVDEAEPEEKRMIFLI